MKVRRYMFAILAGLFVAGALFASAATLGINEDDLGAGTEVVASCDTSVDVAYTTEYQSGVPGYAVTDVVVSDIAAGCVGEDMDVTLADGSDASIGTGSVTITGDTETVNIALEPDAELVEGVSIVITG